MMPGLIQTLSIPRALGKARYGVLFLVLSTTTPAWPGDGALFPEAFRVEHHLEYHEAEGGRQVFDSITDTYGGSWIVSERRDGSRLIVDFARHEIIEVQPRRGTYWVVSMDRLSDLQRRVAAVDGGGEGEGEGADADLGASSAAESALVIEDARLTVAAGLPVESLALRPGVIHLQAVDRSRALQGRPVLEASFDPSIRLSDEATAALSSLASKLGGGSRDRSGSTAALAAMRASSGGAFTIRTSHWMDSESGSETSRIDDIATKLERLEAFPDELLEIPEGFVRNAHPLEAAVRYLEQDEEIRRLIGGGDNVP